MGSGSWVLGALAHPKLPPEQTDPGARDHPSPDLYVIFDLEKCAHLGEFIAAKSPGQFQSNSRLNLDFIELLTTQAVVLSCVPEQPGSQGLGLTMVPSVLVRGLQILGTIPP